MKTILKEVEYIDGNKEFYLSQYTTELLVKNSNTFLLKQNPEISSIKFTGDTELFKKRVYNEADLYIEGSWFFQPPRTIKTLNKSSEFTFTYVGYQIKNEEKIQGLFSVDYEKGILYTSSPLKNPKLSYRYANLFIEGQKATQLNSSEYTIQNIPDDSEDSVYNIVYQVTDNALNSRTKEYVADLNLNLMLREDND